MASTWGENIKLSIFGGSHTEAIGVVLDNLPPNEKIDMEKIRVQMARRAPGKDKTATTRLEADEPQVLSGLFNGVTTGAPLAAIIANTNTRSKDYSDLKIHPASRPCRLHRVCPLRRRKRHSRRRAFFGSVSPRASCSQAPSAARY